jgi:hypothetical protein
LLPRLAPSVGDSLSGYRWGSPNNI